MRKGVIEKKQKTYKCFCSLKNMQKRGPGVTITLVIAAIVVLATFFFVGLPNFNKVTGVQVKEQTCTDSDGGINFEIFGIVTYNEREYPDTCIDDETLREYYCYHGLIGSYPRSISHICNTYCQDGACAKEFPGICGDRICMSEKHTLIVGVVINMIEVTFDGVSWSVGLENVYENGSVRVIVDGIRKIIGPGKTIVVNGLPVKNQARYHTKNDFGWATLVFGENIDTCPGDCKEIITPSNGTEKEIPVGRHLSDDTFGWPNPLTDSDVPKLKDGQVHISIGPISNDYNFHEEISLGIVPLHTGLNRTVPDEDFKDKVFLETEKGKMWYKFKFDDPLKKGNYLTDATLDDPITLEIMDYVVEITRATRSSIIALVGEKFTLFEGQSKKLIIDGIKKTITLLGVRNDGSVIVEVSDRYSSETKIIRAGNTHTINGVRVKNYARIYDPPKSQATLIIGSPRTRAYSNADAFIGENESNPNWIWNLAFLDTPDPVIEVHIDQTKDKPDEVIYIGDKLWLPHNYVYITPASLTNGVWQNCIIERERTELYNSTGGQGSGEAWNTSSQNTLLIEGPKGVNNAIKLPLEGVSPNCAGKETNKIFLYTTSYKDNLEVYWWDYLEPGKSPKYCGSVKKGDKLTAILQYAASDFNFDILNENIPSIKLRLGREEQQYLNLFTGITKNGFEWGFGTKDGQAVASDVIVIGSMGGRTKAIGTWEDNTLTVDGLKIYDPDTYGDANKFKFALPRDEGTDFRVLVGIYG